MMRSAVVVSTLLLIAAVAGQDGSNDVAPEREPKLGFLGGNAITQMAQDLFSRSTTNSQVLSLNLTNLVILMVVKALIFGAGAFGFGKDHHGRSIEDSSLTDTKPLVSESELLLMMSYLRGDVTHNYGCLHYSACQDPKKAKEYLMVSKFIIKGAHLLNVSNSTERYEKLLSNVQEAVDFGSKGYDCSVRYTCDTKT